MMGADQSLSPGAYAPKITHKVRRMRKNLDPKLNINNAMFYYCSQLAASIPASWIIPRPLSSPESWDTCNVTINH